MEKKYNDGALIFTSNFSLPYEEQICVPVFLLLYFIIIHVLLYTADIYIRCFVRSKPNYSSFVD